MKRKYLLNENGFWNIDFISKSQKILSFHIYFKEKKTLDGVEPTSFCTSSFIMVIVWFILEKSDFFLFQKSKISFYPKTARCENS